MADELWFYERRATGGGWMPCTVPSRPETKTEGGFMRLKTANGTGQRVRRVQPVPAHLAHLSLAELARVLNEEAAA